MSFWEKALSEVIDSGKRAAAKAAKSMAEDAREGIEALESDLGEQAAKPQRIHVTAKKVD